MNTIMSKSSIEELCLFIEHRLDKLGHKYDYYRILHDGIELEYTHCHNCDTDYETIPISYFECSDEEFEEIINKLREQERIAIEKKILEEKYQEILKPIIQLRNEYAEYLISKSKFQDNNFLYLYIDVGRNSLLNQIDALNTHPLIQIDNEKVEEYKYIRTDNYFIKINCQNGIPTFLNNCDLNEFELTYDNECNLVGDYTIDKESIGKYRKLLIKLIGKIQSNLLDEYVKSQLNKQQ